MSALVQILPWIQVILAVLLIALVLLQQNEASLGNAFGGSGSGSFQHKKRGLERTFFIATIVVAIAFGASAILALIV